MTRLRDSPFRFQILRRENLVCLPGLGVHSPISQLCPEKGNPEPQTWPPGLNLGCQLFSEKGGIPVSQADPRVCPRRKFSGGEKKGTGVPCHPEKPLYIFWAINSASALHTVPFIVSSLSGVANFGNISAILNSGDPLVQLNFNLTALGWLLWSLSSQGTLGSLGITGMLRASRDKDIQSRKLRVDWEAGSAHCPETPKYCL